MKVYVKNVKFGISVDFKYVVFIILGFVGVDLVNFVNEVVLFVVWKEKLVVGMSEFDEGVE